MKLDYTINPLGDSALIIDFGNTISEELNERVIHLFDVLNKNPVEGMIEVVPAFSSLAIYYDLLYFINKSEKNISVFELIKKQVEDKIQATENVNVNVKSERLIQIPVCYDPRCGIDLNEVGKRTGLTTEKIIDLHLSKTYHVYMLGFLPGFPYMGEIDNQIRVPRKPSPINVPAGSVGIAGNQTGIYPFNSPGGWNIIGRTPIKLFTAKNLPPVLISAGDKVRFFKIQFDEFENYQSRYSR